MEVLSKIDVNTDAEINALMEYTAGYGIGDQITHDEISELIGEEYNTSRYRAIVKRWRGIMLHTYNIFLVNNFRVGYEIASAERRLKHTIKEHNSGYKKIKRASFLLGTTDPTSLDDEKRKLYDKRLRFLASDVLHHESEKKKLSIAAESVALLNGSSD